MIGKVAVIAALLGGAAVTLMGQTSGLCFRGRPAPRCRAFLITEFGVNVSTHDNFVDATSAVWELGVLRNTGTRTAFGATARFAVGAGDRLILSPRVRRWLGHHLSLDVAPGVIIWDDRTTGLSTAQAPGFSGQITLGYRDWVGVAAGIEIAHFARSGVGGVSGTSAVPFVGARLGSYPGTIAGTAGAALIAVLAIALQQAGY
jgi:hypothetical protein